MDEIHAKGRHYRLQALRGVVAPGSGGSSLILRAVDGRSYRLRLPGHLIENRHGHTLQAVFATRVGRHARICLVIHYEPDGELVWNEAALAAMHLPRTSLWLLAGAALATLPLGWLGWPIGAAWWLRLHRIGRERYTQNLLSLCEYLGRDVLTKRDSTVCDLPGFPRPHP
jgi:hypothetical protein